MTIKRHDDLFILEHCLGSAGSPEIGELPGTRPELTSQVAAAEELLAGLAQLTTPVDPPEGLLDAIEAGIDALPKASTAITRSGDGSWVKRTDKIWKKILFDDPDSGTAIYLLRCEAGAVIAPHRHERDEHVFVIEGEYCIENTVVRTGDSQLSRAGSLHAEITIPNGCLILVHC